MHIPWAAIEDAGAIGWGIVGLGLAGVLAAVVTGIVARFRPGALRRMAVVTTVLGVLCAELGCAGVVRGRVMTDRSVAESPDELRTVERLRLRREGYLEARAAAKVGLVCAALPLLAGVAAAFVAARRKVPADLELEPALAPRRGRGLQVGTTLSAVVSSGLALAALVEPVPGRNMVADHASREILDQLEDVQSATESGVVRTACHRLEEAIYEADSTADRGLVPSLPAVARRCVEEGIQAAAVRSPISTVQDDLEGLARSPFVKHDRSLERLVDDALGEVRRIAASPPPVESAPGALVGGVDVSGGSVSGAGAVVAGMSAGFRRCYNKSLQEDPSFQGSLRITAKIGPIGEVLSVSLSGKALPPGLVACISARVSSALFARPEGGGATIVIPVTFVSSEATPRL